MGRGKKIEDHRPTKDLIAGICEDSGGQAITVTSMGPTEADMNLRWKATGSGGMSLVVYQDDSVGPRENVIRAAVLFCEHMNARDGIKAGEGGYWDPRAMTFGGTPDGWSFTFKHERKPPLPIREAYTLAAARKLLAAGLESEGEFYVDHDSRVALIEEEAPGAWVDVQIWIDADAVEGAE